MQPEQVHHPPGTHLYTIKSAASSVIELPFFLQTPGLNALMVLRTHQPRQPDAPLHQGKLTLNAFEVLTRALLGARPTQDFTES